MAESPARDSAVRVALLYPELLGTYGDRGNARVLVQRLAWRGVPVELIEAPWGMTATSLSSNNGRAESIRSRGRAG